MNRKYNHEHFQPWIQNNFVQLVPCFSTFQILYSIQHPQEQQVDIQWNKNEMYDFKAKQVTRSQEIRLDASIELVFPLFEPINEKKWAYGWDLEVIYPISEVVQEEMVFRTAGNVSDERIWTVSKFDRENHLIEYIYVEPSILLAKIQIRCNDSSGITTTAIITYNFTALSDKGNEFIDTFTDKYYKDWIASWQKAINFYLETGTILKEPH